MQTLAADVCCHSLDGVEDRLFDFGFEQPVVYVEAAGFLTAFRQHSGGWEVAEDIR